MNISDKQIEEFRELHYKGFGKEISKEVAYEQATKLLRLLMLIYKPMAVEEWDAIQKQRLAMLPDVLRHIAREH
jgi:hypothetical protein